MIDFSKTYLSASNYQLLIKQILIDLNLTFYKEEFDFGLDYFITHNNKNYGIIIKYRAKGNIYHDDLKKLISFKQNELNIILVANSNLSTQANLLISNYNNSRNEGLIYFITGSKKEEFTTQFEQLFNQVNSV